MDRDGLGAALSSARARLQPAEVGFPAGTRRRVPGLRREEVAMVAGISVDYVVRLEQGRGPRPSGQVLGALSRALQLTPDERDHLYRLAGSEPPLPGRIDSLVRPSIQRLMQRMVDLPVMVVDAKSDLLAWNAMTLALIGDVTVLPHDRRNFNRVRFLPEDGAPRGVVFATPAEHERSAAEHVGDLRATAAKYPDDPGLRELIDDLQKGSPLFARLWDEARVQTRRSSTKTFDHPDIGLITLDCDVAILPDTDQRMIVYSAEPGSTAAGALDLLRVVGVQAVGSAATAWPAEGP